TNNCRPTSMSMTAGGFARYGGGANGSRVNSARRVAASRMEIISTLWRPIIVGPAAGAPVLIHFPKEQRDDGREDGRPQVDVPVILHSIEEQSAQRAGAHADHGANQGVAAHELAVTIFR